MKLSSWWPAITKDLPDREAEILRRNWGLQGKPEKLASIGRDFGLTRERIRQLKERATKNLLQNLEKNNYFQKLWQFLQERTNSLGFRSEKILTEILQQQDQLDTFTIRLVQKLIQLHPKIPYQAETEVYHPHFASGKEILLSAKHALEKIRKYFEREKEETHPEELVFQITEEEIKTHLKKKPKLDDLLEVLSLIKILAKNPFGYFGHFEHQLVYPRSLKDKIIAILHYHKKPLHYSEIYQILQSISDQKNSFLVSSVWQKIYTLETIKNELIRHPEFSFVGKGTYALKEWGLIEGPAKELLWQIIKKEKKIKIDTLWQKISQLRNIKRTTFSIYLHSAPNIIIKDDYVIYRR